MYKLRDLLQIDMHFRRSVNIQLELEDKERIESYIPTKSSVEILGKFLTNVQEDLSDKANVLIGPYGKGKSHLLLVLLSLLSTTRDKSIVIDKINKINPTVGKCAKKLQERKKPFLPVLVVPTGNSLNNDFLFALQEALKKKHLDEVRPNHYFKEIMNTVEKWKKEYPDTYKEFLKYLKIENRDIKTFRREVEIFEANTLEFFQTIYPKLTAGSKFLPMFQGDALSVYQEVNRVICEQYAYGGIYIIFDEFSKFIEGYNKGGFSEDMKTLQDICELANQSKKNQIHITFVAHKSIKEYAHTLPKEIINTYMGVEGRLKEILFVVSGQNNYELIENVIIKKVPLFNQEIKKDLNYKKIIEESFSIAGFSSLFLRKDYEEIVGYGCFPLLPLTAFCLLHISEKIAQNERTVFTFLSNEEKGSLNYVIQKSEEILPIGMEYVYDYFKQLFKESERQTLIHNEWLKADFALRKINDKKEEKVIKAISLIHMLHQEEIIADKTTIRLALGMKNEDFSEVLEGLLKKEIISYRMRTGTYVFKENIGIDIEKEIKQKIQLLPTNISLENELKKFSDLIFTLPKQYNQIFTMTRYFRYEYMEVTNFINLPKSSYLFEEKFSDGKIIALIPNEKYLEKSISKQVEELKDSRLIVVLPNEELRLEKYVRKVMAINILLSDAKFLENNKIVERELNFYKEDILFEINRRLENLYYPQKAQSKVFWMDNVYRDFSSKISFNRLLSMAVENYYFLGPKINHELVNRQKLSPQIKKARNVVVNGILKEKVEEFYKGTSAEATIFRATMLHTGVTDSSKVQDEGVNKLLEEIEKFFLECETEKYSFSVLYQRIQGKKYGVRSGVIPIFLAKKFTQLNNTPILYLHNKEQEFSAETLSNINDKPQDYYLLIEQGNAQKEAYLRSLEKLFSIEEKREKGKTARLSQIVETMQKWYRSLPQCTTIFEKENNIRVEDYDAIVKVCAIFKKVEINPREVLFEKLPELKESNTTYQKYYEEISCIKTYMDNYLQFLKSKMISETKVLFQAEQQDNLTSTLIAWYEQQSKSAKSFLHSTKASKLMAYCEKISTHDENNIIGKIAKICTDLYIEDWSSETSKFYIKEMKEIINSIEKIAETKEDSSKKKIAFTASNGNAVEKYYEEDVQGDSISYFLENAIEEALEDFGSSLEVNQKVSVLIKTIEKLFEA